MTFFYFSCNAVEDDDDDLFIVYYLVVARVSDFLDILI